MEKKEFFAEGQFISSSQFWGSWVFLCQKSLTVEVPLVFSYYFCFWKKDEIPPQSGCGRGLSLFLLS